MPATARLRITVSEGLHGAIGSVIAAAFTLMWMIGDRGYFWPAWIWFSVLVTWSAHVGIRALIELPPSADRKRYVIGAVAAWICAIEIVIWMLTGGTFWPIYTVVVAGSIAGLYWLVHNRDQLMLDRTVKLTERVDVLTRTRRSALDVQATELQRIERDLHDGAQARLVSIALKLGRAEERLTADSPQEAALMREAREEASLAIGELRDLARGIAPPILADRGLNAAIESLAQRSPLQIGVASDVEGRLAPAVETAAYFVVAETLTNVSKHSGADSANVSVRREDGSLLLEIADDGRGGADPDGSGIAGLRTRVEALDGTLGVRSPAGGGTTIEVAIPCG